MLVNIYKSHREVHKVKVENLCKVVTGLFTELQNILEILRYLLCSVYPFHECPTLLYKAVPGQVFVQLGFNICAQSKVG